MFKKFIAFYGTQKFNHHVNMSQSLVLSQINPFHTLPTYFFKIHFNIICPFMQVVSFLQLCPPKPYMQISSPPIHATHLVWLIILEFITLKICIEYYILCSSSLFKFLQPPSTFSLSGSNMFLSTLFSNSSSLCSPLMWETKFHPHLKQQTELSMYFNLYFLDNQWGQNILHYQCFYWMFSIMIVVDLWVHLITLQRDTKLSQKVGQLYERSLWNNGYSYALWQK